MKGLAGDVNTALEIIHHLISHSGTYRRSCLLKKKIKKKRHWGLLSSLPQKDYGLAHLLTALISKSCERRARLRSAPAEQWQGKAGPLSFARAASSARASQNASSPGSTGLCPTRKLPARKRDWGKPAPLAKTWRGWSAGQDLCECLHGLQQLGLAFKHPRMPQIERSTPKRVCAGPYNASCFFLHPPGSVIP